MTVESLYIFLIQNMAIMLKLSVTKYLDELCVTSAATAATSRLQYVSYSM